MTRRRPPHEKKLAMAPIEPVASIDNMTDVTFELQQYAKIVQFCESVFLGHHETVRPDLGVGSYDVGDQTTAKRIELQLRRRKIELQLKDDVESRRSTKPTKFERPPHFDLSNVLAQALALTQAANQAIVEHGSTVANEAASDSHDDNTFYSSFFETPDSHFTSAVRDQSTFEEHQSPIPNRDEYLSFDTAGSSNDSVPVGRSTSQHISQMINAAPKELHAGTSHIFRVPGLSNSISNQSQAPRPTADDSYITMHPPSPLLRDAQPSQIHPPISALEQLTALRGDALSATSAETSSHGTGQLRERGKKAKRAKKKRKVEDQIVAERPPFIKPEPRSPSPLGGPSLRAPKRQRQSRNEAHIEVPTERGHVGIASELPNEQQSMKRTPSGYDPTRPLLPPDPQLIRQPMDREWVAPDASDTLPARLVDRERYTPRDNVRIPSNHYSDDSSHYHSSGHEQPRYATQSGARYFYEPAPTRIYVDANGREYVDPPRQLNQQSAAPSNRHGDARPYYETIAPSPPTRQQGSGHSSVIYARPPSPYASRRRIITEPERLVQEQPGFRYREYTAHPGPQSEQFVEVFAQQGRTPFVDSHGTYIRRATSMMPMEAGLSPAYERINTLVSEQPHQYSNSHRVFARGELRPSYVPTSYSGLPESHRTEAGAHATQVERFTVTPNTGQTSEVAHSDRRPNDGRLTVYTDSAGREVVYR